MIDLIACVKGRTAVGGMSFFMVVCRGGIGNRVRNRIYTGDGRHSFFTLEVS